MQCTTGTIQTGRDRASQSHGSCFFSLQLLIAKFLTDSYVRLALIDVDSKAKFVLHNARFTRRPRLGDSGGDPTLAVAGAINLFLPSLRRRSGTLPS